MSTRTNSRIDFLDYMRIFAFASVLIGHLFHQEFLAASTDPTISLTIRILARAIYDICYAGAAGVIVFFLVSGYIITHVVRSEASLDFVVRRIFRIYPLFIFAVLLEMAAARIFVGVPIPELVDIVPRLLLVGDFFGTPYSLGGVEWTLRVEILFYLFMVLLKSTGLLGMTRVMPVFFAGISFLLCYVAPFPGWAGWTNGYFNMFFPFLLCGVVFYLWEKGLAGRDVCFTSIASMLIMSLWQLPKLKPLLAESNFEIVALALFFVSWKLKDKIRGNKYTAGLSEMTYAVYLTHLWSWAYLDQIVSSYGIPFVSGYIQKLIILFAVSYALTKTVEKYGVYIGRVVVSKIRVVFSAKKSPSPSGV